MNGGMCKAKHSPCGFYIENALYLGGFVSKTYVLSYGYNTFNGKFWSNYR